MWHPGRATWTLWSVYSEQMQMSIFREMWGKLICHTSRVLLILELIFCPIIVPINNEKRNLMCDCWHAYSSGGYQILTLQISVTSHESLIVRWNWNLLYILLRQVWVSPTVIVNTLSSSMCILPTTFHQFQVPVPSQIPRFPLSLLSQLVELLPTSLQRNVQNLFCKPTAYQCWQHMYWAMQNN